MLIEESGKFLGYRGSSRDATAELEQIFKSFHQSERSQSHSGGTGLGQAICREIINMHDGDIWATNNPGRGSSIIFEIPAEAGSD